MKKLLVFIFVISLITLVGAQSVYEVESFIDLKVPFIVNGTIASPISSCNVSIRYPNNTYITNNGTMTNQANGEFNYTINSTTSIALGEHTWVAFCCDSSLAVIACAAGFGDFEVTRTGTELSTADSIVYIIFLFAAMFAFTLALYGSIKIPFKNPRGEHGDIISINDLKYLKIFCIVVSYLLLMFIFGVTRSIMANYLFLNGAHKVFNWLYIILQAFLWPGIVLTFVFVVVLLLTSKKINKAIQRGVPMRGLR